MTTIGLLNEKPLHAALKQWYAQPGDRLEAPVDGYVIDIVRGELLLEIQTGSFGAIRPKLAALLPTHPIRLIYPIAQEKWIVKRAATPGHAPVRRKSPKRGRVEDLFRELVSFPHLLAQENFSLEVLLIQEEELRRPAQQKRWRGSGWRTEERRLLRVVERRLFAEPEHWLALLPPGLAEPFTTRDLADAAGLRRALAQKMAYCLRKMDAIEAVGKRERSVLYRTVKGK
jgi:hypothetical protein